MTDESKVRTQAARGGDADRLLSDPLMKEAHEKVESDIIEAWKNSGADDEDVRERAYLLLRLHRNYWEYFKQIVRTGEAAKRQLLEIEKESKLKRATRELKR